MKFKLNFILTIITLLLISRIASSVEPVSPDAHVKTFSNNLAKIVSNIQPGEWKEIPDTVIPLTTKEEAESLKESPDEISIWGSTGSSSVITAWNGAAYNPDGMKWYFFGGGHADYGGNEVYEFDVLKLKWKRLTMPSPLRGPDISNTNSKFCPAPLEGPSPPHTFDGMTWNPVSKSFWVFNSMGFCLNGMTKDTNGYWEFKPSDLSWKFYHIENYTGGLAMSTWNPKTKKITVIPRHYRYAGAIGPFEVDENGKRSQIGTSAYSYNTGIMEYYPKGKYALVFGLKIEKQRLNSDPLPKLIFFMKSPQELIDVGIDNSGIKYDPTIHKFMIWTGDNKTWLFDPATKSFSSLKNGAGPTGRKGLVYDKFIYVKKYDVFIGYNDPTGNVWIYKRSLQETPLNVKNAISEQ